MAATPARIELGVIADSPDIATDVAVTNRGLQTTRVHAELRDLVLTQAGAYQMVPAGETPYSIASIAHIDRDELDLDANGLPGATADVHLSAGALDQLDRPRYGALALEVEQLDTPTMDFGSVRVTPEVHPTILIPIMLVPMAAGGPASDAGGDVGDSATTARLADSISLELQASTLDVTQADHSGWLDQAIPISLPGVADHGPLAASANVHNTGNAFGRAFTTFEFTAINPLGFLPQPLRAAIGDEHPFLQAQAPPAALMPDMQGETRAETQYAPSPGSLVDSTPWVGLVRVRATTELLLADVASPAVVQDAYVLVLPWKEGIVALGLWALWRLWRARRRRKLADVVELRSAKQPAEAA